MSVSCCSKYTFLPIWHQNDVRPQTGSLLENILKFRSVSEVAQSDRFVGVNVYACRQGHARMSQTIGIPQVYHITVEFLYHVYAPIKDLLQSISLIEGRHERTLSNGYRY